MILRYWHWSWRYRKPLWKEIFPFYNKKQTRRPYFLYYTITKNTSTASISRPLLFLFFDRKPVYLHNMIGKLTRPLLICLLPLLLSSLSLFLRNQNGCINLNVFNYCFNIIACWTESLYCTPVALYCPLILLLACMYMPSC